ncbi:MAG: prepilin-type N-terminal cleavage/methylation domain-containing protein [Gammaproteobacteria bacterium]|nr:prepilin-type N-terminal cleavage/methylation domain-containing protein [Gammaproteobacteria bacterium]NIR81889.1 prepilin-type N-terminal cleavage/methylation domain-containing protein [Gammaproteobacteria bacterium]NIR88721.1 prepilin-type N-terminal cleavage/methylation domain-containing protein [Gammaproteobacteria bacterium]NIU02997.1 prepilin-type N-terminal cleavage/methylation domain-containing protein [Gammaproteobacteria bacterium]NIV50518.1 prepilin-type N-terminal cleavage/methyl
MIAPHPAGGLGACGAAGAAGFTLLEMAVVVAIVAVLLGTLLVPLATQVEVVNMKRTHEHLETIQEALIGFAVTSGNRLPCPDTDGDGVAEAPGACDDLEGYLPWVTLGLGRQDAWGRRFRYRANNAYTAPGGVPSPPDTTGAQTLAVQDRDSAALTMGDPDAPAAIVFSCGKNGRPDLENDDDGTPNTGADCSNATAPANGTYVQGSFTEDTFDDLLVWLSKHTLLGRLVKAGTWP